MRGGEGGGGVSGERPTGSGGGRDGGGERKAARKEARRASLARPASASCLPASVGRGGPFIIGRLRQQEEDGTFAPPLDFHI